MKKVSSFKVSDRLDGNSVVDGTSEKLESAEVEGVAGVKVSKRGSGGALRTKHIAVQFYSLAESMALVRDRGVVTAKDYRSLRKDFPLLPKDPSTFYGEECKGWNYFLGVPDLYSTLEEAGKAAQVLGIKGHNEYKKRRFEDPRLPHDPTTYYRGFPGFPVFLGVGVASYVTYEEASEAAIRLGIFNRDSYVRGRKQDPKLPASPVIMYSNDWKGWPHFLNVAPKLSELQRASEGCYATYEEFKHAVRVLRISGQREYYSRFIEDSMLPSDPSSFYDADWEGWGKAFGSRRAVHCRTWQEAKAVALPYRFTSTTEYTAGYKVDPRLPSDVIKKYPDCPSYTEFLMPEVFACLDDVKVGVRVMKVKNREEYEEARIKYPNLPENPELDFSDEWVSWYDICGRVEPYSYSELQEIMQMHNCATFKDYTRIASKLKDSRIPYNPQTVYEEWTDIHSFVGKEFPFKLEFASKKSAGWVDDIRVYLDSLAKKGQRELSLCRFLRHYIEPYDLGANVQEFLTRRSVDVRNFRELLEAQGHAVHGRRVFMEINGYLNDALRRHFTDEDEDTGEIVRVAGASNPFADMEFEGGGVRTSETVKPALAYQFVNAVKNWIVPETAKNFSDLKDAQKFSVDYYEVDKSLIDFDDPDCIYKVADGKYFIWYPGLWIALYALVSVPARGRQIMYNDSGEGDEYFVKIKDGEPVWVLNDGPLAREGKQDGFVTHDSDGAWGMRFTSNKTSYNGAGYTVPWIPEKLVYWLAKLREWQNKYNPVVRPTAWADCAKRTNLSRKQLERKGSNYFLFRGFNEDQPPIFAGPMTSRLAAALYFVQPAGLTLATFEEGGDHSVIARYKSVFTPHSMRVSLITAYVMDFGMPIEIIMKVVGHASIVMSIYYVKIGAAKMRQVMAEGEKRALLNQAMDAQVMIEQNRLDELTHRMVANSAEALQALMSGNTGTQLVRDFGVCPYAGTRCDDGGEQLASNVWTPAPAGYLGVQNCPRCRHLVTSPVFLGGLVALWNEESLQLNLYSEKYGELDRQVEQHRDRVQELDYLEAEMEESGQEFDSRERLRIEASVRKLQGELEGVAKKMDMYLCDMQAITKLIEDCKVVLRDQAAKGSGDKKGNDILQLIVHDQSELNIEFEETSLFQQLNEVCVNATIYQSSSAEFATPRRSQMIDRMTMLNNIRPVMCNLSEREQLVLGNQVTAFFFNRLKSWEKVDRVIDGSLLLEDLSGEERITSKEFTKILSSRPFDLLQGNDVPYLDEVELLDVELIDD
ncbi:VPA1269 family protein [Pseudomonas chlororaphis]|uniref:gamma-mobile-trio integrase GmtZ n=1 Tax=Pseudomonas chlororaphis TaxID=587753 RepID=UPI002365F6CE|nr:VPA1269 family protein [Pseudomonas chlororaphis]WDH24414.1 VPA1269 family protein [Pseudomonas chlororaphis]